MEMTSADENMRRAALNKAYARIKWPTTIEMPLEMVGYQTPYTGLSNIVMIEMMEHVWSQSHQDRHGVPVFPGEYVSGKL
jgi:hypothetical protein